MHAVRDTLSGYGQASLDGKGGWGNGSEAWLIMPRFQLG